MTVDRSVDALSAHLLAGVLCPSDPRGSDLSPELIQQLPISELERVAVDMRRAIVGAVERNGGHLSSNLGVVELALAVHRVFDSPRDIVIWDTGHQCYPHKMITGRMPAFGRLRRCGGLSGYPSRSESEHDWVENSHAGGALSWAHGWLEGLRAAGSDRRVVAVVGDGALTAGIGYEALNNLGVSGSPVVVVLNDNGRSYAPTVSRLFGPDLNDGPSDELRVRTEACEKFFTALGFAYVGPIDGHDIEAVCSALTEARDLAAPVVVHARTERGKGHRDAETDHLLRLDDVAAAAGTSTSQGTFTAVFERELAALVRSDDRVVAVSAGMNASTGLAALESEHPDRVFDVGVAEQHAATFAAGLAMAGRRPIVAVYSTFFNRCFDQFVLDVSLHGVPVIFVLDRAGITGPDGPSHHGVNDLALALMAPGVGVYAPSCPEDVGPALREAVARGEPAVIRMPKGVSQHPQVFDGPPGTARRWRQGDALLLAAVGSMVPPAYEAAAMLAAGGIGVDLWDVRRVRPLDDRFLAAALAASTVVTVEDGVAAGGAGSWIAHQLGQLGWRGHIGHVGVPDAHVPHGSQQGVRSLLGLDGVGIAARCKTAIGNRELT